MAPAAVTSIATNPPDGNPIARAASLGLELAVELAVEVGGDDAKFTEPAWAEEAWEEEAWEEAWEEAREEEALELDDDEDSLAALDASVLAAEEEEAVAVALTVSGAVM
ncbi:hypothetical protein MMC07_001755 [Pseudocyphellaria aurata]|nr:hypothetical protein [Pseudocyphellaria aurata]